MLMLAFLHSLAKEGEDMDVPLTEQATLRLPTSTLLFESGLGYDEPKEHGRLVPLDYFEDGEEEPDEDDIDEEDDDKTI